MKGKVLIFLNIVIHITLHTYKFALYEIKLIMQAKVFKNITLLLTIFITTEIV